MRHWDTNYWFSIATQLSVPYPVLLQRIDRPSKYDPLVGQVKFTDYDLHYTPVKLQDDGKEGVFSIIWSLEMMSVAPSGKAAGLDELPPVLFTCLLAL